MYRLHDYVWMLADRIRVDAYSSAIRAAVRPGDRVLEIGAGFGFFSVLAAHAGAARVDAVDTNPVVRLGPRVAAANGCADRIVFHHCDARRLELDEPADVLIADLRGPTPFAGAAIETIVDARTRLLRPDGRMIAVQDRVMVAPSRAPEAFRREIEAPLSHRGVLMTPVEDVLYDTPLRCRVDAAEIVAAPQPCVEIDYRTVDRTDHGGTAQWVLPQPAIIDGLAVWFEAELAGDNRFRTGPADPPTAYSQVFFPFRQPTCVAALETLRVRIDARLVRGDYIWAWRAWVASPDQGRDRLVVDQNSLAEFVVDPTAFPLPSDGK